MAALAAAAYPSANSFAQKSKDDSNAPYQAKPWPADSSGASFKTKPIPPLKTIPPSAFNTSSSPITQFVEYRSQDQMSPSDRALAISIKPTIQENATLAGFDFEGAKWTYQQIVCKALPEHLFLLFKDDNGTGDVSLFSVAIPINSNHQVRVIPIRRRGFALFSPAPVNPLTISAFNRIRAGEPASKSADWLSISLCYAALTGAHPELSPMLNQSSGTDDSLAFPPTLQVETNGNSTVRFVDETEPRQPREWALSFDVKGQLLKVTEFPTPTFTIRQIPPLPENHAAALDSH